MPDPMMIRWLAPVAALAAAPACAATYFTVDEAQQAMLPGQALSAVDLTLTPAEAREIAAATGVRVRDRNLKAWHTAKGDWFYVDRVIGKHEFITYALVIDAAGKVAGLEILDYRESYGGEVRNPKWRAQFVGKQQGATLKLDVDIVNLSGATLSCRHLTEGVRRLLATHERLRARG